MSRRRGQAAEAEAARYLERQGLRLLARNFSCRWGEIDLIAEDGDTLVFVEVRWRRAGALVDAAASIDGRKRQKLWRTAQVYLSRYPVPPPCRLDALCGDERGWQWLQNIEL